ncbi:MAG: ATP-binding cassette domain-containing protein [Acidimicrobiia bacterium]
MLSADRITYRIGETSVVAETSLEVYAGEFIAVVGPNGAGKTTLLAMLAGELSPTSGTVFLEGEPLGELPLAERARRRAYLPPSQLNEMAFTVRDVVTMGRHPWRSHSLADDELVEAAMRAAGVEVLADRVFSSLSTGEAQLAQIALILAQDTALFLLDEPTAGLDIAHQERVLETLRLMTRGSQAVVAVIHDLNAAVSVANRILVMSQGSTVAVGSPSEVLNDALLSEVYAHSIAVVDHPFREGPLILLRSKT